MSNSVLSWKEGIGSLALQSASPALEARLRTHQDKQQALRVTCNLSDSNNIKRNYYSRFRVPSALENCWELGFWWEWVVSCWRVVVMPYSHHSLEFPFPSCTRRGNTQENHKWQKFYMEITYGCHTNEASMLWGWGWGRVANLVQTEQMLNWYILVQCAASEGNKNHIHQLPFVNEHMTIAKLKRLQRSEAAIIAGELQGTFTKNFV